MFLGDLGHIGQIGDSARDAKGAGETSAREVQGSGKVADGARKFAIEHGSQRGVNTAPGCAEYGSCDSVPSIAARGSSRGSGKKKCGIQPIDSDAQVYPVHKRSTDSRGVSVYKGLWASARTDRVSEEPTRAWVHRRHEREPRGEADSAVRSNETHPTVLERLPESLQGGRRELRQFIKEQHPTVSQADLSRTRRSAAADETCRGA
jgi:hypothetical protein